MKKVVIIGAGVAGLVCGVYAQRSGLQTEILEMHTAPGGECTGWNRGGFYFDGCIHWLTGSKPGTPMHALWRTTGALDDSVQVIHHEILANYEDGARTVSIYTDANKLEKHLAEISPKDQAEIARLCGAIRAMADVEMPLDCPPDRMTAEAGRSMAAKSAGAMARLIPYTAITMGAFAQSLCDPIIGRALQCVVPAGYKVSTLISTLACLHKGDGGYPVGGSRAFAKRMEQRYLALGGKVAYRAKVERIIVENHRAVGVLLADGREITGDYIVSCADGHHTLYQLLSDQYTPPVYRKLYRNPAEHYLRTCAIVFMGVAAEIGGGMRSISVRRSAPVILGGTKTDTADMVFYGFDGTTAPKGNTVVACYYDADYDHWHTLDKPAYQAEKQRLADDAAEQLIRRFPQAGGRITCTDVVTPETYVHLCNAWRGAWMSWGSGKDVPRYFPGALEGLDGFLMAGMWTLPPGGLPGAAAAGRFATYRLCDMEGLAWKGDAER